MPDRQKDLRDCLTAYDCRDRLPELSAWMDDDLLKELTIWHGTRFERDEEYFDLDNPERGPFVATGAEGPPTAYTYVSRSQAGEEAWAQLITWRRPVSESQGEAIQRLADEFGTGPAQSAAGDARPRPGARESAPGEGSGERAGLLQGTVARLVPERGFGFIAADDGQEFFFHRSALKATAFEDLAPGVAVTFAVGRDPGDEPGEDPRAVDVRLADTALPGVDYEALPPDKAL
jgi:cold shock CspA family protein